MNYTSASLKHILCSWQQFPDSAKSMYGKQLNICLSACSNIISLGLVLEPFKSIITYGQQKLQALKIWCCYHKMPPARFINKMNFARRRHDSGIKLFEWITTNQLTVCLLLPRLQTYVSVCLLRHLTLCVHSYIISIKKHFLYNPKQTREPFWKRDSLSKK